jgi:hypothetical protein
MRRQEPLEVEVATRRVELAEWSIALTEDEPMDFDSLRTAVEEAGEHLKAMQRIHGAQNVEVSWHTGAANYGEDKLTIRVTVEKETN